MSPSDVCVAGSPPRILLPAGTTYSRPRPLALPASSYLVDRERSDCKHRNLNGEQHSPNDGDDFTNRVLVTEPSACREQDDPWNEK